MAHEKYLTHAHSLSHYLDQENLVIVDCVWDSNAYLRAHIPHAIMRPGHPYIKVEDANGDISKHLPDPDQFVNLMSEMGIGTDTKVVCYDEWHNHFATRLWWLMTYYGHTNVFILDGGWQAWVTAGLPISTAATQPKAGATYAANPDSSKLIKIDELLDNYQNPEWQIIDVRSDDEYNGIDKVDNKRGGHIPGALHLEWNKMIKPDANDVFQLRTDDEMEQLLNQARVSRDRTTVVHCQSGVRATFMAYCLELLEYTNVKVYDGSMSEWANLDHTPLE